MANKIYRTALYLRLSKEDQNKADISEDSDSIKNQRYICEQFVQNSKENFKIVGEYVDDGYSGTDIKSRQGMVKLMADIGANKIDCVILKKGDRLTRNMRDYYTLEACFVRNNTRVISVLDNYDSDEGRGTLETIIRAAMNANYSITLSNNVLKTFKIKKEQGQFIGAFASYGYKKDEKDKNHLVIDEPAAKVVKQIFDDFLHGKGQIAIAQDLNMQNIPCPSEYKKQNGLKYSNSNKKESTSFWTYSTIHNILKNKMYAGDMWQNRNQNSKLNHGKRVRPEDEHIIVRDTHEAIVNRDDFELVQNKLKNNRDISSTLKQNVSPFAGHIVCECGQAMSKITNKYKGVSNNRYVCRSYKNGAHTCTAHSVHENDLEEAVLDFLNSLLKTVKNMQDVINKAAKDKDKTKRVIDERINSLKAQIAKQNKRISGYEDLYADGEMSKENFLKKKQICKDEIAKDEAEIVKLNSHIGKSESEIFLENPIIATLLKNKKFKKINKELVDTFINKIVVHEDEKGEISLEIIPTFKI